MSTGTTDQFDQLRLPNSPVTPGTRHFIDSCLANFDLGGRYQSGEQDTQEFDIDMFAGEDSFTGMLENFEFPGNQELQQPAVQEGDLQFQEFNFHNNMQDIGFDIDQEVTESEGEYSPITIDDSHIDPELRMLDEWSGPIAITPSKLQLCPPSGIMFPKKVPGVYESITISSVPEDGFKDNTQCQPSSFTNSPTDVETSSIYTNLVPIYPRTDLTNYFVSTSPVPRIRINGSYTITHSKSGTDFAYTTYASLPTWHAPGLPSSGITYNSLGFLDKTIVFNASTLTSFIRHHPLGPSLVLRIEKHPYEAKNRYISSSSQTTNGKANKSRSKPKYTTCRAKDCALGGILKVGEYRVAIDEVSGRFKESDESDNDPYFSSCFLHLQCFESLTNITPILTTGTLIPDCRSNFIKEPPAGKNMKNNNKMAFSNKELTAFRTWRANYDPNQPKMQGKDSLHATLWLANIKKARAKCLHRAPPGVTQEDIDKQLSTRALWGGRRAMGVTVAEMNRLEQEGRCDLLIAPRNGLSKKMGMGPTGATAVRFLGKKRSGQPDKRNQKRAREPEPDSPLESSPDPKRRRASLQSPPQKKDRGPPMDMRIQVLSLPTTKERLPLSPILGYSPSLATFDLLGSTNFPTTPLRRSTRGKVDHFSVSPLTPTRKSVSFAISPTTPMRRSLRKNSYASPMTPTRRSPRGHERKKVNYAEIDEEKEKENDYYGDKNEELFGLDLDMEFDQYVEYGY
jgi:hypothetical protein